MRRSALSTIFEPKLVQVRNLKRWSKIEHIGFVPGITFSNKVIILSCQTPNCLFLQSRCVAEDKGVSGFRDLKLFQQSADFGSVPILRQRPTENSLKPKRASYLKREKIPFVPPLVTFWFHSIYSERQGTCWFVRPSWGVGPGSVPCKGLFCPLASPVAVMWFYPLTLPAWGFCWRTLNYVNPIAVGCQERLKALISNYEDVASLCHANRGEAGSQTCSASGYTFRDVLSAFPYFWYQVF